MANGEKAFTIHTSNEFIRREFDKFLKSLTEDLRRKFTSAIEENHIEDAKILLLGLPDIPIDKVTNLLTSRKKQMLAGFMYIIAGIYLGFLLGSVFLHYHL